MKKLAFILIAMFALTLTYAQESTKVAEEDGLNLVTEVEELVFEETTINYGEIVKNADGVRYFKFENKGNQPVILSNCKGSCGCTVPVCPKEAVLPGEGGEIKVKYDTNRVGPFTKSVTVTYEYNGETKTKSLKIKGTVKAS